MNKNRVLSAIQVMQLQELLSAARAEVQLRGSNIQILEENLAARRRRDVALTIADDEGQTVSNLVTACEFDYDIFFIHSFFRSWNPCVVKLSNSLLKMSACRTN
jgi:hypothetical protein